MGATTGGDDMGAMTNVALATPPAAGPNWTLIYTAASGVTCKRSQPHA
jgi:hypothetical protein